jgi:ubiquinone/menaquinone biosynthesis C-methylase UbiE
MTPDSDRIVQGQYYTRVATEYDQKHVSEGHEHALALELARGLPPLGGASSVLDVGCGTGRAMQYFRDRCGISMVRGVEPVAALAELAVKKLDVPPDHIHIGQGEQLPFPDASFDVVSAFGVLHHVREPNKVVGEMMRVARLGIVISDSNRFGQGHPWSRRVKLMLWRCGLWPVFNRVKTRGRGYTISEGDGLAYSYSVYDSLAIVQRWANRVMLLPTGHNPGRGLHHPLLTSSHILLVAVRQE